MKSDQVLWKALQVSTIRNFTFLAGSNSWQSDAEPISINQIFIPFKYPETGKLMILTNTSQMKNCPAISIQIKL
jgi:hypothetical protein